MEMNPSHLIVYHSVATNPDTAKSPTSRTQSKFKLELHINWQFIDIFQAFLFKINRQTWLQI